MNFGTLKDIFLDKLIESYTSDNKIGKTLYKKFIKTLKENETLKTAFIVFKNIENKTVKSETIANNYLKENISFLENFRGENSLKEQSKKLVNILEENKIDLSGFTTKEMHKSLDDLINTKKSITTIDKIQESKNNIISWLVSDKIEINETDDKKYVRDNIDPNKFLEVAINKFNEKYKDSLTEEEKNILKILRSNSDVKIKGLVSNLIKETIKIINDHLTHSGENISIKKKLLEVKDVIYGMTENDGNYSEKALKLYELKKNII
jgi:hypothetical protein